MRDYKVGDTIMMPMEVLRAYETNITLKMPDNRGHICVTRDEIAAWNARAGAPDHIVDANKMVRLNAIAQELGALRNRLTCTCELEGWPCVSCQLFYLAEAAVNEDGKAGPYDLEADND